MSQENKIKNRIDYKTLSETLSIQTKYNDDEAMLKYIRAKLSKLDVTVQEDGYGNIYVTKGKAKVYPCVVAHTDTVQSILTDVQIYRSEDTIFAFDPIKRRQHGIGGDDKVGVYITLQLLVDMPIMKAVFFRDEEIGCKGSNYSIAYHKDWYSDCGYVLMADRRGNNDVIVNSGGIKIASDEFLEDCSNIFEEYNYEETTGIFTDVDTLSYNGIGISTVNLSCGYHEPHSPHEVVSFTDVNRCYNLMYDILTTYPDKRFDYEVKIPAYKKSRKASEKIRTSLAYEMSNLVGPTSPVNYNKRQKHLPLVFDKKNISLFDNFVETDTVKGNKKVFKYIGVKSLPLTGEVSCPQCNVSALDNVFYLPYEGRMFCTQCNSYVDDKKINSLLKFLEFEDRDVTFVYSSYSVGWLKKDQSLWDDKLTSWVTDSLPFYK